MPNPNNATASTATAYNDGSVQYGSILATINRGQPGSSLTLGVYILESDTPTRPTKNIERPDQIGGANGFVMINLQEGGNVVVQMGDYQSLWPQNGDWFEVTLDPTIGVERWVLGNRSEPREMNSYFKANFSITKAHFPASIPNFTPS